jgi:hypothetical protein
MSGSWLIANGLSVITMNPGGAGAIGTGAFTLAGLWNPVSNNSPIMALYNSTNEQRAILQDSQKLYSTNDFTAGFPPSGTITASTWWLGGVNKPSASAHFRYHLWQYASNGSGTMQHGETTAAANQGNGSTIQTIKLGTFGGSGGTAIGNHLGAVFGGWDRELSDAEWDTLKSPNLSAWAALAPKFLIELSGWNGTTGAVDRVGTSTFSSLSGTVGVGAEPPSFNYSLSGAPVQAGAMAMFV